jgi:hypothetical protein
VGAGVGAGVSATAVTGAAVTVTHVVSASLNVVGDSFTAEQAALLWATADALEVATQRPRREGLRIIFFTESLSNLASLKSTGARDEALVALCRLVAGKVARCVKCIDDSGNFVAGKVAGCVKDGDFVAGKVARGFAAQGITEFTQHWSSSRNSCMSLSAAEPATIGTGGSMADTGAGVVAVTTAGVECTWHMDVALDSDNIAAEFVLAELRLHQERGGGSLARSGCGLAGSGCGLAGSESCLPAGTADMAAA